MARDEPTGRRGLCCAVYEGSLYLYGGYGDYFNDPYELDVYDSSTCKWTTVQTNGEVPQACSGCSCASTRGHFYLFGGWYVGMRTADVYELNLTDKKWKKLTYANMKGAPLCKDKAGMVDYGESMLCIMGGYGYPEDSVAQKGASYHWDPTSRHQICWTNELHLFHIDLCKITS